MKVLMITGGFPLGSETFVSDQVTGLLEAGCDLEVLALRPGDETAFDESFGAEIKFALDHGVFAAI